MTTTPQRFTGLDRGLDLRLPSNQYAVAAPFVAGAISMAMRATPLEALSGAGWAFSTWSLGRELDPDRPLTAALASGSVIALLALEPRARGNALAALSATGALMMVARATLNSTGKTLRPADEFALAVAPVVAERISGAPLSVFSLSSLAALSSRNASWWSLALSTASLALTPFSVSKLHPSGMSLSLLALGALNAARARPQSPADDGSSLEARRWRKAHGVVWAGAILGALVTPWTVWAGVAVVGVAALVLERAKPKAG